MLAGRASVRDVCAERWEVAPEMTATARPALYLAGQLERVRGYQEDTNREHE